MGNASDEMSEADVVELQVGSWRKQMPGARTELELVFFVLRSKEKEVATLLKSVNEKEGFHPTYLGISYNGYGTVRSKMIQAEFWELQNLVALV